MSNESNPHIGSSLDAFLAEEGILDECSKAAKAFERTRQKYGNAFYKDCLSSPSPCGWG